MKKLVTLAVLGLIVILSGCVSSGYYGEPDFEPYVGMPESQLIEYCKYYDDYEVNITETVNYTKKQYVIKERVYHYNSGNSYYSMETKMYVYTRDGVVTTIQR